MLSLKISKNYTKKFKSCKKRQFKVICYNLQRIIFSNFDAKYFKDELS